MNKLINNKNVSLPWIEKYRPNKLNDVVSHVNIINILKQYIKKHTFPNLILFGSPGTGKTSIINACAHELFGEYTNIMALNINASEERGIDIIRNRVTQFAMSHPSFAWGETQNYVKLIILDEADSMTVDAQLALKNVIDTYSYTTRFCLICNCIKKIHYSIVSRCVKFRIHPLPHDLILSHVKLIQKNEHLNISDSAINKIILYSHGDMRRVINILQAITSAYENIDDTTVVKFLNDLTTNDLIVIVNSLICDSIKESSEKISKIIKNNGYSICDLLNNMNLLFIKILFEKENIHNDIQMNEIQILNIIKGLGKIEYLLYSNINNNIIIGMLSSLFISVKNI